MPLTRITKADFPRIDWDNLHMYISKVFVDILHQLETFLILHQDWEGRISCEKTAVHLNLWLKPQSRRKRKSVGNGPDGCNPERAGFINDDEAEIASKFIREICNGQGNIKVRLGYHYEGPFGRIHEHTPRQCLKNGLLEYVFKVNDYEPFLKERR